MKRFFQGSIPLMKRWPSVEDKLLMDKYKELGPAWTALALSVESRSPTECRRRYLKLSGELDGLSEKEYNLVYEEGYERYKDKLVKIPQEKILSSPFVRLANAIDPVRFRSQRRLLGWNDQEKMAVREGFEQYGPNWRKIASKLKFRTERQCRNLLQRQFITVNKDKIEKIQ